MELNRLYNMDCMEAMRDMPDKFFDLAIVDPPYGIGVTKMRMGNRNAAIINKSKEWDASAPDSLYFDELRRVSKNQIIWGGNYFDLPPTRGFAIWDKGESMYKRSLAECEYAWTSFDVAARIIKIHPNAKDRIHPTQKPVELYMWILAHYANPGDKILDTHAGSASSLIACHKMGHEYVGYEIDKDYYRAALARLEAETRQISIDDI